MGFNSFVTAMCSHWGSLYSGSKYFVTLTPFVPFDVRHSVPYDVFVINDHFCIYQPSVISESNLLLLNCWNLSEFTVLLKSVMTVITYDLWSHKNIWKFRHFSSLSCLPHLMLFQLTAPMLLFQPKHDHNLRDSQSGDTPLMSACLLGRVDIVAFLLQSAKYSLNNAPTQWVLFISSYSVELCEINAEKKSHPLIMGTPEWKMPILLLIHLRD